MINQVEIESPDPSDPQELQEVPMNPSPDEANQNEPNGLTRSQAFNLYTSHFLSTWNVRTYEFAAVCVHPTVPLSMLTAS
jgi:iron-regulated transporter 1